MEKEEIYFPDDIYQKHLFKIKNIKFTPKEIKIISFTLSGRSAKKTASYFSISPKTVESHTRNIKKKIDCNSREGIVDFIEKSGKFAHVKRYYLSLLIYTEFESALKKISLAKLKIKVLIVQWHDQDSSCDIVPYLKHHLKLAGIVVSIDYKRNSQGLFQAFYGIPIGDCKIYLLPKNLGLDALNAELAYNQTTHTATFSKYSNKILICPEIEGLASQYSSLECLNLNKDKNYYFLVFKILRRLLPSNGIENTTLEFQKKVEDLSNCSNARETMVSIFDRPLSTKKSLAKLKERLFKLNQPLKVLKGIYAILIIGMGILGCSYYLSGIKSPQQEEDRRQRSYLSNQNLQGHRDHKLPNTDQYLKQVEKFQLKEKQFWDVSSC